MTGQATSVLNIEIDLKNRKSLMATRLSPKVWDIIVGLPPPEPNLVLVVYFDPEYESTSKYLYFKGSE